MTATLYDAADGCFGFDTNEPLSPRLAKAFCAAGYKFAIRYVPRTQFHPGDLTADEVLDILAEGLGLMVVQHVESESSWTPTQVKGQLYGQTAQAQAQLCGLPAGSLLWLDLEGVCPGTSPEDVISYCEAWYEEVVQAGFVAGLYVGWHCGLSPEDLYMLSFEHYWSAYNLNSDEMPAKRGCQLRQHTRKPGSTFVAGISYQTDLVVPDDLGGVPVIYANEGWC